jgi:hypothetical protein
MKSLLYCALSAEQPAQGRRILADAARKTIYKWIKRYTSRDARTGRR